MGANQHSNHHHPLAVSTWRKLADAGLASEVADAIVKTQPVPERLLRALAREDTTVVARNARAA